jgi:hypothetical protein
MKLTGVYGRVRNAGEYASSLEMSGKMNDAVQDAHAIR